jgi:hypothetical protein
MDARLGFVLGVFSLALAACNGGGVADTYDTYDTYDTCDAPYGAGADGAPADCCGGGCCGAGDCCGGGFAPCDTTGGVCNTDEECGPGLICQDNYCTQPPVNQLVECEQPLALADSTFGAGVNDRPGALAVTDFTGDGIDDLMIASSSGVAIWESRGDSTFSEVGVYNPGVGTPIDMRIVDVDKNMADDILVLGEGSPGRLGLLLADELNVFLTESIAEAGAQPTRMEVGDLNGDGFTDIVLMSQDVPELNIVNILLSDGAGGFLVPIDVTLDFPPLDIELAKITAGPELDLVVAHAQGVTVLEGRGNGGFDPLAELTTATVATQVGVTVADLDGAGGLEIVSAQEVGGQGKLSIWSWTGPGTAPAPSQDFSTVSGLTHVMADDLDGDGRSELIASTGGPVGTTGVAGDILVMPIDPDGTVRCQSPFGLAKAAVSIVTGDFDDDGRRDIATASGEDAITLLLSGS